MKTLTITLLLALTATSQQQPAPNYRLYLIDNANTHYDLGTQPLADWSTELHSLDTNGLPRRAVKGYVLVLDDADADRNAGLQP